MASDLSNAVRDLAREDFTEHFGHPEHTLPPDEHWARVRQAGTTLWLDTGDIDEATKLLTAEFSALTTNNTLLNAEIQKGIYDGFVGHAATQIRRAKPGISPEELALEISFVLNAKHGLRLVSLFDTRVSVELHTALANDVEASIHYGRRYYAICPERFIVKIPFTAAGLLSARQLVQDGIPINFTLGFSARQNYVIALFTNPNWVNVFMGRLNAFVADSKLGSGENVGEKATLATQRALLQLRATGRSQSHLIGASMRGGAQVATLAGLDVFTMPPKVAAGYRQSPSANLSSQVGTDPPVAFDRDGFGADTLWEIPEAFKACVERLLEKDVAALTPHAIVEHFAASGFPDFLPAWPAEEIAMIGKDGKIPVYETWKQKLAGGQIGLDALMNMSALQSFVTDQAAPDNRVMSLL
ncbi:MAG: transaldolase [Candidatus Hydrogenedentes bacterium]|nr:transaldolase [Candidatus Hydrogenedentota bacterium]